MDETSPRIWMTKGFADDVRGLPPEVGPKIEKVLHGVRTEGVNHRPLRTRRIVGNPDSRFRLMDIDDKYRVVVAVEGAEPLFMKAGNHDETIAWGSKASLGPYVNRLALTSDTFRRKKRRISQEQPVLVDTPASLPEILEHGEELSDLVSSDVFGFLEGYRDGLIEDWMIFLSPLQNRAVQRSVDGPARVTGGPGTGKTVVGLHRAAAVARAAEETDRILVTSFVNTVPEVLDGLFERLAPEVHDRVVFRSIHTLAHDTLEDLGTDLRIDDIAARARFDERLTSDAERRDELARAGFGGQYLWDEVSRVIEGREVADLAAYLALERHGRAQPMYEPERRAVWTLYTEYLAACARGQPPIVSWPRHFGLARAALAANAAPPPYRAIIVDEAQDITEAGLRFLLALLEGGSSGQLLLIGDNAQRIYPGGFRLGDLGIESRGRSFVLETCYRSTHEIMEAANALGRYLSSEEFGDGAPRITGWQTSRYGPRPLLRGFATVAEEQAWLAGELVALTAAERDAAAVLVPTNRIADLWRAYLPQTGVEVCDLMKYKGRPLPGVKVGTHNRAKGLEFARVFAPNLSRRGIGGDPDMIDDLILRGSKLYVAMTRARDRVDLSYAGEPSVFVDSLREHVDIANSLGIA